MVSHRRETSSIQKNRAIEGAWWISGKALGWDAEVSGFESHATRCGPSHAAKGNPGAGPKPGRASGTLKHMPNQGAEQQAERRCFHVMSAMGWDSVMLAKKGADLVLCDHDYIFLPCI